jgi:hypothetical protein
MEELFITCPHCWQQVSILVDLSISGRQSFVEDCEVCCNPLAFELEVARGQLLDCRVEVAQ